MPKNEFPMHWKGENGIYCGGLSRRGLEGVAMDAEAIANDINQILRRHEFSSTLRITYWNN